jgi:hypothetical protein
MDKKKITVTIPHLGVGRTWAFARKWLLPNPGTLVLMLVFVLAVPALALPPGGPSATSISTVPYQGRLADASGHPITSKQNMEFRIYDVPTAGVPLWEEYWTGANSVNVSDGLFSVMLGSINTGLASVIQGHDELYLGITVGTDSEMEPRVQLGSVPFSIWSLTVADDSITSEKIEDGTIQAVDMAPDAFPPGVPVGTVISWWRPNATMPLPSEDWAIADGSVVNDPDSPLYGQALPNLTDRFVMGVAPGNIGVTGGTNTLNLSHRHQVDDHTHSIPSHAHDNGTLRANVAVESDRVYVKRYGAGFSATYANYTGGTHYNTHITGASADVDGDTGSWSGTSGASHPNTNYQLSSATDNRPQYVGVLFLVRIK